ncbi:50S ribosomal protein L3 N(5)-glutamine methyltransferase [Gammaproteobacteria bacterium]|nr:50S ribosomal protein L3 N(5)-glutamine methyltransferase [Gammaproteobacteria bacterium]
MRLDQAYDALLTRLDAADLVYGQGSEGPHDEAAWLLCHVTEKTFDQLEHAADDELPSAAFLRAQALVERRIAERRPLAYLLGEAWYGGLKFIVDESVLIPRSHLVEWLDDGFAPWLDISRVDHVLDLCCGSGCIGLSLAARFDGLSVDLSDISQDALSIAARNIDLHDLHSRARTIEGDLFEQIDQRYSLIVSNPPYVDAALVAAHPDEFCHEPTLALVADDDGLAIGLEIMRQAPQYLSDDGVLVMELGQAAPALDERLPHLPLTWLYSDSGEAVVLIATRNELSDWQASGQLGH